MALPTFHIKQNDTSPTLDVFLRDDKGRIVSVTGATVLFHLRLASDLAAKITNGSVTLVDSGAGHVRYTFTAANTDTAGTYQGEFQVTFADATIESFPNNGYIKVVITDDVA